MNRPFSINPMAICAVIGCSLLFSAYIAVPGVVRAVASGTHHVAFDERVISVLAGNAIALGLLAAAFSLRRCFGASDVKIAKLESDQSRPLQKIDKKVLCSASAKEFRPHTI
jgi:hypothetical protein